MSSECYLSVFVKPTYTIKMPLCYEQQEFESAFMIQVTADLDKNQLILKYNDPPLDPLTVNQMCAWSVLYQSNIFKVHEYNNAGLEFYVHQTYKDDSVIRLLERVVPDDGRNWYDVMDDREIAYKRFINEMLFELETFIEYNYYTPDSEGIKVFHKRFVEHIKYALTDDTLNRMDIVVHKIIIESPIIIPKPKAIKKSKPITKKKVTLKEIAKERDIKYTKNLVEMYANK